MLQRSWSTWGLLALVIVMLPTTALAQGAVPAAQRAAVERLRPRALVRIHTVAGESFYGRLLSAAGDTLVLTAPPPAGGRVVALGDVAALDVQRGTYADAGALAGFVAGAGLGGAAISGLAAGESGGAGAAVFGLAAGVVAGGTVGLIGGSLFGATIPRWRRRYP